MNELIKNRIKEVLALASELNWIYPIVQPNKDNFSYPLMQLSEVEKCMIAMVDQTQFNQMRIWCNKSPLQTFQTNEGKKQ